MTPQERDQRQHHALNLALALRYALCAQETARLYGRRTDCIDGAVKDLRGALRCVDSEDSEAKEGDR